MSSINFDNVYLLFIAVPLVVLLAVPFFLAVKKDNANGHNVASLVMHVVMAVLIAFTAAGTSVVATVTETDVYVVADVSYSANKNLGLIDEYIGDLGRSLPRNSRMGVICFGKDYQMLTRLGGKFTSVNEAEVDDSETDIVSALEYAGSLFREDVIKRIVLITDGRQSYEGDTNALKRAVDSLTSSNIHVDAIFLDDNVNEASREVQLSDADFTQTAYLNRPEKVSVVIQSSYETSALLSLYRGGQKTAEKAIHLTQGANSESFDLYTAETGVYEYEVRVEAEEDESPYNNALPFTQTVAGTMKVLLVTQNSADSAAVSSLYGDMAEIDAYVNPTNIPSSVEALCAYDEIVISNADLTDINNYGMFISSLDTVVSLFGKSLITLGDTNIQSYTEGQLKGLEDMLPVRYGNNAQDPKLYTIVIDGSRSMETLSKLNNAKRAANQLVRLLNDDDEVAVVVFNGDVEVVQSATKLTERDKVIEKINGIEVQQGTFISLGLSQALNIMKSAPYSEKQIMLISDGLTFGSENDNPLEIVKELAANEIYVSALDIGRGKDNGDAAVRAKELLTNIADQGGGSYFYAPDASSLENVLFGEITADVSETIVNGYSAVKINKRNDEVVKELTELPYVAGFVNSGAKASATTVLTVDYRKASGGTASVPLYAYWGYGNGRVASFTSSISGDWIEAWRQAGTPYETFFRNVLTTNIPQEKISSPYLVSIRNETGYTVVELTPSTVRTSATASVQVSMPGGESLEGNMAFSSSVYTYRFTTPDAGKYDLRFTYSYAGKDYTAEYSFTIPYLPEYDAFAAFDASVLHKAVGGNGTVSEDGKLAIVNDENEVATYTVYLTVPLLVACVVLFAADIVVRKLKWDDIKSLFKKVNK